MPFTRQELNKIYNEFEKKDMPRAEFIKQATDLLDPELLKRDAGLMVMGRMNKKQIDQRIAGAN